jgi:hypothetical protein
MIAFENCRRMLDLNNSDIGPGSTATPPHLNRLISIQDNRAFSMSKQIIRCPNATRFVVR